MIARHATGPRRSLWAGPGRPRARNRRAKSEVGGVRQGSSQPLPATPELQPALHTRAEPGEDCRRGKRCCQRLETSATEACAAPKRQARGARRGRERVTTCPHPRGSCCCGSPAPARSAKTLERADGDRSTKTGLGLIHWERRQSHGGPRPCGSAKSGRLLGGHIEANHLPRRPTQEEDEKMEGLNGYQ